MRPVKEQLTIFLKKMCPEGVDRTIAKSPDANFPALNMALFQPLKRKRSRADKLHPNSDGSWSQSRAPGVEDFEEWTVAWELMETCFYMTDTVNDGLLTLYYKLIQRYQSLFPDCWPILLEAEELARFQLMPQIKRELSAQEGYVEWPAKTFLDKLVLSAAKNRDFWREHFLDRVTSFRTSSVNLAKRARLVPGPGAHHSSGQWSQAPSASPPARGQQPNRPGTRRQFCRAY